MNRAHRVRALGLDVGERRIGLAISDPEGRVAVPRGTIVRGEGETRAIAEIVRDEEVELLVVGLPLMLSGEEGAQAAACRAFGDALSARLGTPCVYWDERLSSIAAERLLRGDRERARERIDTMAATLILQAYLDSRRERGDRG